MLLSLDPGMNSPGVALFREGTLVAATRVTILGQHALLGDGARWLEVARCIVDWIYVPRGVRGAYDTGEIVDAVVFERPQWYARVKSKGDPNQLAGVAGVAASVAGMLSGRNGRLSVFSPTPAEWIGQLSKVCPACKGKAKKKCATCHGSAWKTPRGRFIRKRLSDAEFALAPDQNDAIDAVGLGLFQLGRLKPHTVLSNGRDGH